MVSIDGIEHVVTVSEHDMSLCNIAKHHGGNCGTTHIVDCSCGFAQGTRSEAVAEFIASAHVRDPEQCPVDTEGL